MGSQGPLPSPALPSSLGPGPPELRRSPGRAANSEGGRWGLTALESHKQSHSDCPQSWQSGCQSRLTCLCVLGHGHFTSACASAEVALTPPPSRVSTGQAESEQGPRPLGPAPSPPSRAQGPVWRCCSPPPHTAEPALTRGRRRAQQRPEK